jgi:outer membrane biosynthesis protein TonB
MKDPKRFLLLILALLMMLPAVTLAESDSHAEDALPCEYTAPEEVMSYISHLYDDDPFTTATLKINENVTMTVPADAQALYVVFFKADERYTLTYLDAEGKRFNTVSGVTAVGYNSIPIPENAAKVMIIPETRMLTLSEFYAVKEGFELPFPDTSEQADVLVYLNTPGDELEKLGGVLPLLCGEHGLSAQIIYTTAADGYHSMQCLQILRQMGIRRMPVFGKAPSRAIKSEREAYYALGMERDQLTRMLVNQICSYRPKIVITLDPASDSDRFMEGYIAQVVIDAANLAETDNSFMKGVEPFTVSKLYTVSDSGETVVSGEQPLYAYDQISAAAFAGSLYKNYLEKQVYRRKLPGDVRFRLEKSAVGEDRGDDLLENLSTDAFTNYRDLTPTPVPTAEPTPEPTEEPTPEPTSEPKAEPTVKPTEEPASEQPSEQAGPAQKMSLWWLPAVVGLAIAAAAFFLLPKQSKARIPVCLILLIAGLLISGFLLMDQKKKAGQQKSAAITATEKPTEAPTEKPAHELTEKAVTPEPTDEPTPEPTEEPTPEPTPAPTARPDDEYFLQGDGEEYELDFDNGHWWYKNNALAIDVKEIHTSFDENGRERPLVYYVADIRMRDYSSYRSGLRDFIDPWRYARYEKAVFAITGDNLDRDEREEKGCLLRKGVLYCNFNQAATLVIENDMSLSVIQRGQCSERVLMDRGIRDTYGFGPILVVDGKVAEEHYKGRVSHANPRCGLGMIEPGHWIAIATEGRQSDFSYSVTLDYFANMFVEYGCSVAFNLDGGASVGVVFMGEAINRHARGDNDAQRPWYDAVMFGYSENVPSPDIPTVHNGYRHDY